MEEVQQLPYGSSAPCNNANGGMTEETNEKADKGASTVSTALGTIKVKSFRFARYRICIKPSNPEAQEIIAERLRQLHGWHKPDPEVPYFTKIFSLHASDEALAAVTPSLMD